MQYSAAIVTNGYLLSTKMIDRLCACSVTSCQITIDGTREDHNARRPHMLGIDTYDTLLQNACHASYYLHVGIRVNLDKGNQEAIFSVQEAIARLGASNITVYPAPIRANNDCYSNEKCFCSSEFIRFEQQYYASFQNKKDSLSKYPRLQGNCCCADSISSYVISSNGDMYKCWSDIGRKDLCIGNILEGTINKTKAIRYLRYDPTRDPKCEECEYLPICMGGCPRDVIDRPTDRCPYVAEVFERYLVQIADTLTTGIT